VAAARRVYAEVGPDASIQAIVCSARGIADLLEAAISLAAQEHNLSDR